MDQVTDEGRSFDDIGKDDIASVLDFAENDGDMHIDPEDTSDPDAVLEAVPRAWRVAKALDTLLAQINAWAPGRNKLSDGGIGDPAHQSRNSDHNAWIVDAGIGVVSARDFTHDPAKGCDCNKLAEMLRASRDKRIKYIIWNRRICASEPMGGQPSWAWRPYTGTNGHTHHLHLSVLPTKALYDSTTPWVLAGAAPAAPPAPPQPTPAAVSPAAAPAPPPAAAVPAAGTPAHALAMAELDSAVQALLGLQPLLERLTGLQDSPNEAIAARAGDLLARYVALTRHDLPPQPQPAAPLAPAPAAVRPSPPAPLPPFTGTAFEQLKDRYEALYAGAVIRPEWAGQVGWHRQKLLQYRPRYTPVATATGVPWWFIGITHALEAGFAFTTHLHNGDPLTARTVHVPAGRPPVWNPPSDWESSAIDALTFQNLAGLADWSLARALHRFEAYNGFSYYRNGINSPYLWSFSNQYSKGKFVADHVYDPDAVSKQCGAAVMLKALSTAGDVTI